MLDRVEAIRWVSEHGLFAREHNLWLGQGIAIAREQATDGAFPVLENMLFVYPVSDPRWGVARFAHGDAQEMVAFSGLREATRAAVDAIVFASADKAPAVSALLLALRLRFGAEVAIASHWDADRNAVGIVRASHSQPLVYVACNDDSPLYYVALEAPPPPGSDIPYSNAGDHLNLDFESASETVIQHLRLDLRGDAG